MALDNVAKGVNSVAGLIDLYLEVIKPWNSLPLPIKCLMSEHESRV